MFRPLSDTFDLPLALDGFPAPALAFGALRVLVFSGLGASEALSEEASSGESPSCVPSGHLASVAWHGSTYWHSDSCAAAEKRKEERVVHRLVFANNPNMGGSRSLHQK
eukprot:s1468_g20.t1